MVLEREFWGSIRAEEKPMADWSESARPMLNAITFTGASGPRPVETRATCTLGPVIASSLRACENEVSGPEAAAQIRLCMRL